MELVARGMKVPHMELLLLEAKVHRGNSSTIHLRATDQSLQNFCRELTFKIKVKVSVILVMMFSEECQQCQYIYRYFFSCS